MNYKKLILVLCCSLAIGGINAQTATFNYTGSLQTWTVPCTSSITITAYGAQGGTGAYGSGGLGAEIVGTFTVAPGEVLDVLVGQAGVGGPVPPNYYYCGSGGGGTFVWNSASSTLPLVAAGGGGGSAYNCTSGAGSATTAPTSATGSGSGAGGSGGNGGAGGGGTPDGNISTGGGGAGWLSNGANGTQSPYGGGGFDPANGGAGGAAGSPGGVGGYGGGGGCVGNDGAGGGGGGYNGGGGGNEWNSSAWGGGGGGGSYNGGSNQTNVAGVQSGNGLVTITWVAPSPVSVTGTIINSVSCNGGSNGSASETTTGGSSPYTYLWTPTAQTNATATGLTAGTYTITVSDACGSTASSSVAITQPTAIIATAITTTNVTCNAGSTGATASTVTGGTSPYTYSWTGGSTNTTATGLTAGSYTLSVTDKNGCSATTSTVVTQPNVLSDSSFTTANVLCHGGSTGSAGTIVSGGTTPYTYLWTPGGGTTDTATGLTAGTYSLMVSDACGASATASATITQPTAIGITAVVTPDNGHGVGTAKVTVSGGVGPYTYLWTPGGKTTDSIGGLTKGTYCCDVKDANGCKDSICVFIKTTAEGIDGISDNSAQISVYPNPNNGQFTIESSVGGASSVEIYNILGEKVYTRNLSTTKGTNTINVSNQPNGVYLYRIVSDNGDLLGEGRIAIQK